jgi:hypothetical protein
VVFSSRKSHLARARNATRELQSRSQCARPRRVPWAGFA